MGIFTTLLALHRYWNVEKLASNNDQQTAGYGWLLVNFPA